MNVRGYARQLRVHATLNDSLVPAVALVHRGFNEVVLHALQVQPVVELVQQRPLVVWTLPQHHRSSLVREPCLVQAPVSDFEYDVVLQHCYREGILQQPKERGGVEATYKDLR